MNRRPPDYEPDELPDCSIPLLNCWSRSRAAPDTTSQAHKRFALLRRAQRPGNGCGGWTRTSDPRVMSPMRYQLRHPAILASTVPAFSGETAFIVLLHHRSQPSLRACTTASFFISIHRESCCRYMLRIAGGEEEIRTLVAFPPIRLPSDAVRPLRHLSSKNSFHRMHF